MDATEKEAKPKRSVDVSQTLRRRHSKSPDNKAPHRSVSRRNSPVQLDAPPQSPLGKFLTRVLVGAVMIGAFSLILYGGHMYVWIMVVVLQTLLFRELVNVRYKAAREKNIPWFRSVQWMWFGIALLFSYGESLAEFLESRKIRFVPPIIGHYLRYHTWISFTLYALLFMVSVLSLKKGYLKYQMGQYTWTIVTLVIIVFQMKYVLVNIFNGLYWFVFPVSLVIFNDCFAFFCGKLFGRAYIKAPFLRLSPNKTWEGFIGAFMCTIFFAFFFSGWLASFDWMICPLENFQLKPEPLSCVPKDVFRPQLMELPKALAMILGKSKVELLPIQVHSIVFASFASIVAPFGGFFASAIKRTYRLKDFDSVIPGHGGVMDRMDCQFINSCFTTVYYNTFISSSTPSVIMVLNLISRMPTDDQHELFQKLQQQLQL